MNPSACPRTGRPAFTLVELMVVITIIAILVALATVAVQGAMRKATQTTTQTEIGNMSVSVATAKSTLRGVNYLPSSILLHETLSNYAANDASRLFLQQAFGRQLFTSGTTVDWNGDGAINPAGVTLYGDQALVFWLGGIPAANGNLLGFSTNPTNPAASGGTRIGPFFEFKSTRLLPQSNGFYRYVDAYGTGRPYIYFSSYRAGNDYNAADNGGIAGFPSPYYTAGTTPPKYLNANGFQIISAGRDGVFGAGGSWNTGNGYGPWAPYVSAGQPGNPGGDDQANFSRNLLGSGQE